MRKIIFTVLLIVLNTYASITQTIQPPQPATLQPNAQIGTNQNRPNTPPQYFGQNQAQNQHLIQQNTQGFAQQQSILAEAESTFSQQQIQYDLPDNSAILETKRFRQAFAVVDSMLTGQQDLSLKKAIFEAENAWYGGSLNYDYYCADIANMLDIIKTAIQQEGYTLDNDMAKKWILHRFMSDTLQLKDAKGAVSFTHLPYEYDFDDPFGKTDYSKMFVTKLMQTRKGQCRSLPLLYLILAEELGVKAWLAYAPEHNYIRLQNNKGNWFNLELTNGHYSADSWILGSSFIKSEALRNQLYMDTLSKKELIASTLNELGKGYAKKFGYDGFVRQCAETTLKHHSKDVFAMQLKSDWATMRFKYVVQQLNYPPKNQIHRYPKAQQILEEMYEYYRYIDQTGYEPMPEEIYKTWLKSFNDHKSKQPTTIIRP